MLTNAIETLKNAAAVEGYGTLSIQTMIPKTTLWRICTKGHTPSPHQAERIREWYKGHPRKEDLVLDGPAPKSKKPIKAEKFAKEADTRSEKFRQEMTILLCRSIITALTAILQDAIDRQKAARQ